MSCLRSDVCVNSTNFFSKIQKPFPNVSDGKINTQEFINAAKSVVNLVEKLGAVFSPVKYDMNGNIEKILRRFETDKEKNGTLQGMVISEQAEKLNIATDALLWLNRALHFVEVFLGQIVEKANEDTSDSISGELTYAYDSTVKRYHGWMTQKVFLLICKMCPSKSQFYESMEVSDLNSFIVDLKTFIYGLRLNRTAIQNFYLIHKLDHEIVV